MKKNKEQIIQIVVQNNDLVYLTDKGNVYTKQWDGVTYVWIPQINGSGYNYPAYKYKNITPELLTPIE